MKQWYGWYSQKMFDRCGGVIYKGENDKEILVTNVSQDPKHSHTEWSDSKPLGKVYGRIRDAGLAANNRSFGYNG